MAIEAGNAPRGPAENLYRAMVAEFGRLGIFDRMDLADALGAGRSWSSLSAPVRASLERIAAPAANVGKPGWPGVAGGG